MAHKVKDGSFADSRRGSRHKRGYGSEWDSKRERIKQRAAGLCEPCLPLGIVHTGHECDHKISKAVWQRCYGSLAGVDDDANLQWINRDCHRIKTLAEAAAARGVVPQPDVHRPEAEAGMAAGPGAPSRGAPGSSQAGGGEKSGASLSRTERLGSLSCAGVSGGGGTL